MIVVIVSKRDKKKLDKLKIVQPYAHLGEVGWRSEHKVTQILI